MTGRGICEKYRLDLLRAPPGVVGFPARVSCASRGPRAFAQHDVGTLASGSPSRLNRFPRHNVAPAEFHLRVELPIESGLAASEAVGGGG